MITQSNGISHCGLIRKNNEDLFYCNDDQGIFIICDGVGGSSAGEVAAKTALEATLEYIENNSLILESYREKIDAPEQIFKFGSEALNYANRAVFEMSHSEHRFYHMGTTLTMALRLGNKFLVCHVGDSRLYMQNNTNIFQITDDHTMANELFLRGLIDEGSKKSTGNILTRAIGLYEKVDVDTLLLDSFPGDRLILCSDGIYDYLKSKEQLSTLAADDDLNECLDGLISFALDQGGKDNATAIIIDIIQDEESGSREEIELAKLSLEVIRDFVLFQGLSYSQTLKLKSQMEYCEVEEKEVLLEENEEYYGFYLIVDGAVETEKEIMTRGDSFGLKALFDVTYSENQKVALRDSRLLVMTKTRFQRFINLYPRTGNKVLKNLIQSLINN